MMAYHSVGEEISAAVLEQLTVGIAVLGDSGEVVLANRAIREIAAAKDGIGLAHSSLTLEEPEDHNAFLRQTETLRRLSFHTAVHPPTMLRARRKSGKLSYGLTLARLPQRGVGPVQSQAVLVCVTDPTQRDQLTEAALGDFFELSPAEARLTRALTRSGSLASAAGVCRLTKGSARQYMKSIYTKTGTTGQVELVALVVALGRAWVSQTTTLCFTTYHQTRARISSLRDCVK